jgi:anti-sigma regulatory factor (Ser/Thr protein kinase)
MTATDHAQDRQDGFSHEALFYAGAQDFVAQIAAFIREGLANDEPALVMVTADKIELLRDELGPDDAARVLFSDMAEAGRNPGRIISAWSDFAAEHLEQGRTLRGVGEPIWAARSSDELRECQHHESLLNVAFGHADGFRLVCPYDTDALPADVIDEARRSHPLILEGNRLVASRGYRGHDKIGCASDSLPPPQVPSEDMGFQQTNLAAVRGFVSARATDAGLPPERVGDLLLAVNEAATNSVRHAGGQGVLRIWRDDAAVVCEVRDRGRIDELLAGRLRPASVGEGGHGLWMANQLCDLVQLRTRRSGTVVRMHMRLAA